MLIEARNLHKRFVHRMVLAGLDFTIQPAEFIMLAGPNGAGKTTLLRLLAGLLKPDEGRILLDGRILDPTSTSQKQVVGFAGHQPLLYADLTAEENLRFYAHLYHLQNIETRITTLFKQLDLEGYRHERVSTFSRGMLQRLSIARVCLHQPRILLLDEPYSSLDTHSAVCLDELLHQMVVDGSSIVMTTHELDHGQNLVDRLDVLVNGHIEANLPREGMKDTSPESWYVQVLDHAESWKDKGAGIC
ncbi:MAG: heme ABC exporter ATP-binding protein CcmA [Anaerolineaceae bacterium]